MEITFYGHACFDVQLMNTNILFDPFITPNALAKEIDINNLNPNYILLTHGHQDHMADASAIAERTNARIVANYEVATWFQNQGFDVHPMNHGGSWSFDFGKVKMVNAVHSSMLPDGSNGGNPAGFIIETDAYTFYFAGDTALTIDMQLIPRFAKLDLAILPIGDNFTMGVDDAIVASDFIECDKVLGLHYDTFPYIEIDKTKAVNKFNAKGKELILMDIGESRVF
ncbi:MAG TPA: metal-dependent hydrolase [Cyclobacteriaceae bacterium]